MFLCKPGTPITASLRAKDASHESDPSSALVLVFENLFDREDVIDKRSFLAMANVCSGTRAILKKRYPMGAPELPLRRIDTKEGMEQFDRGGYVACRGVSLHLKVSDFPTISEVTEGFVENAVFKSRYKRLTEERWRSMMRFGNMRSLGIARCSSMDTLSHSENPSLVDLKIIAMLATNLPENLGEMSNLKRLVLHAAIRLKDIPASVCDIVSLETLMLTNCTMFERLPEDIGRLENLRYLSLYNGAMLTRLPDSVCDLKRLEHLDVSFSLLEALPEELGGLESLRSLDASFCKIIESIPESVENLKKMTTLRLSGCTSLLYLPAEVGGMTSLETMDISGCVSLSHLPESMIHMTSMKTLDISDCIRLEMVPESLESMDDLEVIGRRAKTSALCAYFTRLKLNLRMASVAESRIHIRKALEETRV